MSNKNGHFIWYELMTTDADAAEAFYGHVLGWKCEHSDTPGMDYRIFNTKDAQIGGVMKLGDEMIAGGARPAWMGYVSVDDADAAVASVESAGGKAVVPPSDIPDVGRFAMIVDPQGVHVYVLNDTSGATSRAFEQGSAGHCAWNELATPDPSAAMGFYGSQFGWTAGETMPMGPMGDYQMFDVGGETIGGIMSSEATKTAPMWRFYFRVPRLDKALEGVRANGGQVVHGPQEVPGNDEVAIGFDPQGAQFALVAAIAGK